MFIVVAESVITKNEIDYNDVIVVLLLLWLYCTRQAPPNSIAKLTHTTSWITIGNKHIGDMMNIGNKPIYTYAKVNLHSTRFMVIQLKMGILTFHGYMMGLEYVCK